MTEMQKKLWVDAERTETAPEALDGYSKSEDLHLLRLVSQNPQAWESTLLRLARHKSPYVRYGVIKNPNVTKDLLLLLSKDAMYDILKSVACHPMAPEKALINVINSDNPQKNSLLTAACSNVTLNSIAIKALIPGACINMKRGFAVNVNTPTKYLCELALDVPFVRYSLALREYYPQALCEVLKNETNVDVQKALFENENAPSGLISQVFDIAHFRLREVAAVRNNLPQSVRGKIIYGDNPYAKVALLKSALLTSIELDFLKHDTSHLVRIEVAKQVNTMMSTMEVLKDDASSQVVIEVVRNKFTSEEILDYLCEHENSLVRREVALKDNITANICYRLSADTSPIVKKALIKNPNTVLDAISELAFDFDEGVSTLAKGLIFKEKIVPNKYEYLAA